MIPCFKTHNTDEGQKTNKSGGIDAPDCIKSTLTEKLPNIGKDFYLKRLPHSVIAASYFKKRF